ncbi:hypothetical protein TRFO_33616 [Tritrichomonas foetus]|uniref:VPS9 domain-containing protein n=1 Tax=Tritrichomonas foetus TaxID=1144522 RepID=A0A1J4JN16_9EUKA|nr:hypothetical protein TRFO_33616 [Tritrichomonas foetus]|eukprot:OHS99831.1 hypothetical protein TRFO_33616 [Tritrichomonas foetus]
MLDDDPDSILFAEKPMAKKRVKRAKAFEDLGFSPNSSKQNPIQGIDLLAPTVKRSPSLENEKKANQSKTSSAAFEAANPFVKKFVFFVNSQDFSISKAEMKEKINKSVEQTYIVVNTLFFDIRNVQKNIDNRKRKIAAKIEKVNHDLKESVKKRAAYLLYYDMLIEFYDLRDKHISEISDQLNLSLTYIQIAHEEFPLVDIKININTAQREIKYFPKRGTEAAEIEKRATNLKRHIKKMKVKPQKEVVRALKSICKVPNFDDKLVYFYDDSGRLETFIGVLSSFPLDFQKRVNLRIVQSITQPEATGQLVLYASKELCNLKKLSEEKYLKYIFVFFARHFFNEIYTKSLFSPVSPSQTQAFVERVSRLRHVSPIGFGIAKRYLDDSLITLPLDSFPHGHLYEEPAGIFASMSFDMCPLDFCHSAFEAFKIIQITASNFSFNARFLETGQLFAKSDSLLSFDDLFDISFIVFLLSGAGDMFALTEAFSPFIHGMMMPSEFEFAFTNLSEICRQIAVMDIDQFINDAMLRTKRDQEKDPLMIANYVMKNPEA